MGRKNRTDGQLKFLIPTLLFLYFYFKCVSAELLIWAFYFNCPPARAACPYLTVIWRDGTTPERQNNVCNVAPEDRTNCGYGGIDETRCLQRGCCYDNSIHGTVWCFFKKGNEWKQNLTKRNTDKNKALLIYRVQGERPYYPSEQLLPRGVRGDQWNLRRQIRVPTSGWRHVSKDRCFHNHIECP